MPLHHTSRLALTAVATATLVLSACGSPKPTVNLNTPAPPILSQPQTYLLPTLVAHHWTLVAATNRQNQGIAELASIPARPLVLGFDNKQFSIQGACNLRGGGFQIDAQQQLVAAPLPATRMACEPALMQRDQALASLLAQPAKLTVEPNTMPKLTLVGASGDTLVFHGQPTLEALYGPATLMFLEVAPQKVACTSSGTPPNTPIAQCLLVRERRFDANGLAQNPPGNWQTFPGSIEGFSHTAGERSVLRLKRFSKKDDATGATSFLFVLDLRVETERVGG